MKKLFLFLFSLLFVSYMFGCAGQFNGLEDQGRPPTSPYAGAHPTDTTNFDNNLSSADTTVQAALETLDEVTGVGDTTETNQDDAWAAVGGAGTETLITVTYQDATNDVDFVVDSDLHNFSWTNVDATDLKTGSVTQAYDADLAAIAALAKTDGNIIVGNGSTWVAESGATARTSLGLAIGTNVQAYDAELAALAGLTSAANKLPYFTGSETADVADLTAFGRSIIDDADEATFKATVNLEIGTDVQAYHANLAAVAGGTYTGDDSITTLGTIATGTWQGDAIGTTYAGTDLDHSNLAATITFADGDFLDFSNVDYTGGGDAEGIALPTYVAATTPTGTVPYMAYDAANNRIMVWESGGWVDTSSGSGAATTLNFLVTDAEGSLTDESVFTDGYGIDHTDAGGDGGAFTVGIDTTEISADGSDTWSDGSQASVAWTINTNDTADNVITFTNGLTTFNDAVTVTDTLTATNGIALGTSKAIVGTTAVTLGDNTQTWAVNSSDWDISATGDMTGIGAITADGTIEGATLTEGGVAVYNSGENCGGELGGTWASPTIDDSLSVSSWTLVSPTITTSLTATDLIDSAHYVADSIDNEHINWADIDNLGDEGLPIDFAVTQEATVADDIAIRFGGAATDWYGEFDDSVDDQFLWHTTSTAAVATTDPMFEILVDFGTANGTGMTADQQVFGVSKGTQASNVNLFNVDEDGDMYIAGSFDPDSILGDDTDDNLLDQDAIEGFAGVADPFLNLRDSDAAGADEADEEAGRIYANMITATEDAEDSDMWFTIMQSGTRTTILLFDESDDQWETTKNFEVPDEAYNATTWDANNDVPTKNAIRDKIEGLAGTGTMTTVQDGGSPVGDADIVTLNFDGTVFNITEPTNTVIGIDIADDGLDSDHYASASVDPEHVSSGAWDFGTSVEADTLTEGGVAVHNNDEMDASSELAAIIDDETGSGLIMFNNSPALAGETTIGDSGGILFSDDNYIELDATADGMDDDEYNGVVIGGRNCGESLSQWDLVEIVNDADPWHKADATAASGEYPAFGISVAACTDTNEARILVKGIVRNEGWTGLTPGGPVYLGETDGALTQTAPSTSNDCVQIVGYALSDSEIYFDFSRPWQLVE